MVEACHWSCCTNKSAIRTPSARRFLLGCEIGCEELAACKTLEKQKKFDDSSCGQITPLAPRKACTRVWTSLPPRLCLPPSFTLDEEECPVVPPAKRVY